MSQYKSASRTQPQHDSTTATYREGARQLQEMFPTWSNDDLIQLLTDVGGDVATAATKISEGSVEPWGEVSRKKDKKPTSTPAHPSRPSTPGRGDFRGARGGRGGRGGPGRGGAVTRGRGGVPKPAGANGHAYHAEGSSVSVTQVEATKPTTQDTPSKVSDSHDLPNGANIASNAPSHADHSVPASGISSTWGAAVNGNPVASASKHPTRTPATSKLSFAQVARPVEKPTPPPVLPPSQSSLETAAPAPPQTATPVPESHSEFAQNGWEETPAADPPREEPSQTNTVDDWPPSTSVDPVTEAPKAEALVIPTSESRPEVVVEPTPTPPAPEPIPEPPAEPKPVVPQSSLPAQVATPSPKLASRPAASHRSSTRHKIPDQPVTLPSSFGSGLEKVGMQFGSFSLDDSSSEPQSEPESAPAAPPEPAPAPPVLAPQPFVKPHIEAPVPAPPPATAPAASSSLSSVFQHQQQQQAAPVPQQPIPPQVLQNPQPTVGHHLPTSVSQPIPTSQSASLAAASPLQQFAQQHQSLPQQSPLVSASTQHIPHHLQQQAHAPSLPQQLQQNQSLHSYSQHGLPSQLDSSQQSQGQLQSQSAQGATHSSYFRGSETSNSSPYFQNVTPPASQSQESTYGSFGQLGSQVQHQQQGSHLGGFSNNDYTYNDSTRGFYDTYSQQPQQGFASRNQLAHDDVKSLSSASQQSSSASLPPSSAQGPQSHSSQTSSQPQPNTPQGPQQQYPPPVPYYYTHAYPQNQYYGSPYSSGYVPQPFVKYPTMFQPGPPGPASTANPASKQPTNLGVGVQPQANPYNQGLYQQGGYDEYQAHPHHSQHQHNHSLGLGQGGIGVNSTEYGKPLYGGAQSGMQGFMGLSGQTGSGASGPVSNAGPRSSTSPEVAYKPYASKDVGVSGGRGVPGQQGQSQVQPQNQNPGAGGQGGPQGQGFYNANRFTGNANATSATSGTQQGGPQGHLGYPQGVSDNFYGYQPRQQQYWQ